MSQDDISDATFIPNELRADDLKEHLRREMAPMSWADLATFFARGQLIVISPTLDLLDVAMAMSKDSRSDFERWMASGDVRLVDDAIAKTWSEKPPRLLTVVIAPWVLVQIIVNQ